MTCAPHALNAGHHAPPRDASTPGFLHVSAVIALLLCGLILVAGCSSGATSTAATTTTDPTTTVRFDVMAHGEPTDQQFRDTITPDGPLHFGNGRLTGTTQILGRSASVELLAQIAYVDGSGPFIGYWIITFDGGDSLTFEYHGTTTRDPDVTVIDGTLRVIGGTGTLQSTTGDGTVHGERVTAVGGDVDYQFELHLSGAPA